MLGRPVGELLGTQMIDLVAPEDVESAQQAFERVLSGEQVPWRGRVSHADGSWRVIESTSTLLRDKAGEPWLLLAVARDITEQQALEDSRHARERRYRAIIENASELIVLFEFDGTVRFASPSYATVLGYDPDELVGQLDPDELVDEGDLPEAEQVLGRLAGRRTRHLEWPAAPRRRELALRRVDGGADAGRCGRDADGARRLPRHDARRRCSRSRCG